MEVDEVREASEIRGVPGVQGHPVSQGGGSDQEVGEVPAAGAAAFLQRGEDATVGTRDIRVEGQGVPVRGRPVEAVLPAAPSCSLSAA